MQASRKKSRGEELDLGDGAKGEGEIGEVDLMKTGKVSLGKIVPGAEVSNTNQL